MSDESLRDHVSSNDEVSLKEVVLRIRSWREYLYSKWITIVIFVIIGALIGFSYAQFQKPVYTATTTFVLETGENGSALGQYAGIASIMGLGLGGGTGGGIFQGDNIMELYKSRAMIKKSLLSTVYVNGKNQLLIDRYIDFNRLRETWKENPNLSAVSFGNVANTSRPLSRLQDSLIGVFVNSLNKTSLTVSKPDKELSIIRVDVKAKDEVFAKAFNDQIVKNVNDFYIQTKTKKSLENVSILQRKTDSVKRSMNSAIYYAAAVADATPNLNQTRLANRTAPIQRSQFNAETNKAVLAELVKNLEMSKISLMRETPLIQVVDAPVYPLSKEGIGRIKGIVLGALIAAILTFVILISSKIAKNIMA